MVELDEILINWLIDESWKFQTLALPNPTVGALLLSGHNQPLSFAIHQKSGCAHAELEAVRLALVALGILDEQASHSLTPWELYELILNSHRGALRDCTLYSTLEPCNHEGKTPSCAKLLAGIGIKRVVFGAWDPTLEARGGGEYLRSKGIQLRAQVSEKKALDLLYPFLLLQQKGHFNLYKLAQRLNGNYRNGQISHSLAKSFTHTQRGVASSLIISGKTLREDQPRLDLRYAWRKDKEEIPIQILTHQDLEPKDYSCIHSSAVSIHHKIDTLRLEGFNLIEGGYTLLESLREKIDALLLIISPCFEGEAQRIAKRLELQFLYAHDLHSKQGANIFLWLHP